MIKKIKKHIYHHHEKILFVAGVASALLTALLLYGSFFTTPPEAVQATSHERELSGWAWSSNIGWISFNCKNTTCPPNYSVKYDPGTGKFNGYAWSSSIGWVKFNPGPGPDGYPASGPNLFDAKLEGGIVKGWIRACSVFVDSDCSGSLKPNSERGGWDGWISMSDGSYGVTRSSGRYTGFAWGSDILGWIKFCDDSGSNLFCVSEGFNFSLSVSDPVLQVTRGNPATQRVTATLSGGDPQNVNFTYSISPAINTTPSPASGTIDCTPNCSWNLTIPTNSSTVAQDYTFTITGTAGSVVQSIQFTLRVDEAAECFDFALTDDGSKTVDPGGTVSSRIDANLRIGPTQPITFDSIQISPDPGNITFDPATLAGCNPPCIRNFDIQTDPTTPPNTYTITVSASGIDPCTGKRVSDSTSFPLTVRAPGCPTCTGSFEVIHDPVAAHPHVPLRDIRIQGVLTEGDTRIKVIPSLGFSEPVKLSVVNIEYDEAPLDGAGDGVSLPSTSFAFRWNRAGSYQWGGSLSGVTAADYLNVSLGAARPSTTRNGRYILTIEAENENDSNQKAQTYVVLVVGRNTTGYGEL